MIKRIFPLIALLVFFSSCEDNILNADPKIGPEYYPVKLGDYRIYDVTETTYLLNVPKTENFQIRERLDEISTDQAGRQWHRVEVSQRAQAGLNWRIVGVKMLSASPTDLLVSENNQTRLHLLYPVVEGKSWKSNPLGSSTEAEKYSFTKVMDSFKSGTKTYPNTITLIQANTDNLLNVKDIYEVLAMDVGPIFRRKRELNFCNGDAAVPCQVGEGYIVTGTDRQEVLVESGQSN